MTTNDAVPHPLDVGECGDYRRDHPNDGPCNFNGRGFDTCHGGRDCLSFRLDAHHIQRDPA